MFAGPKSSGTLKLVINSIPNPGLTVILLPSLITSASWQPKEPYRCNRKFRLQLFHASRFVTFLCSFLSPSLNFNHFQNTPTNKIFRKAL